MKDERYRGKNIGRMQNVVVARFENAILRNQIKRTIDLHFYNCSYGLLISFGKYRIVEMCIT